MVVTIKSNSYPKTQSKRVHQEKFNTFLDALEANGGQIKKSCEIAGVSAPTVYRERRNNPEFAKAWLEREDRGVDVLESEAIRRAVCGYIHETVMRDGTVVQTTRYSDPLLIFLLKAKRPEKYRELVRTEITGKDGGKIEYTETRQRVIEELVAALPKPVEESTQH